MKIKMKLALFLFFGICGPVFSQILKVDKGSIDADSSDFFIGSINFDLNLNNRSANTEENITFRGLTANADLVYVADQHAYILINKIDYFKSTGGPLISTGYTHFRINFLRKRKVSYETFSQIQFDDGRNMPYRLLFGGGIRFQLLKSDRSRLHLGIGGMHENEKWKSLIDSELILDKNIWKTSNYVSGKISFNEKADFNVITYYQGGYDTVDKVFRNRISGDIVLSVKLTNKLAFTTRFTVQYEDKPIIPINGFVYSLTNGFKWDF